MPLGQRSRPGESGVLGESGRFERFSAFSVLGLVHTLAVAHFVDVKEPVVDLDPAGPTACGISNGDDDMVSGVNELLSHGVSVIPGALPAFPDGNRPGDKP